MSLSHIRQQLPRRRGNQFYRDKRDFSALAQTLCGASVTDRDVTFYEGGTKTFRQSDWPKCDACMKARGEQ